MDMLSYMHQGKPYGNLTLPAVGEEGGKDTLRPILPGILARMVGGTTDEVEHLLSELEAAGVFSRTPEGIIFSRRMVADERIREIRASGGIQSLNHPNVPQPKSSSKDTLLGSLEESLPVSFMGSPSSSSSSSKNKSEPDVAISSPQKKPSSLPSHQANKLATLLKSELIRNKPDSLIPSAHERSWAVTAQRMLDRDGRTYDQIEKLIRWVQSNEFELKNVRSMEKLRKRFDELELKADAKAPKRTAVTPLSPDYVPASERISQERLAGGMQ
jgi:hypothetical protein